VRRFLRRALWPYLAEQRRVDSAVLEAVTHMQRSIEDIERRVCDLEGGWCQNAGDESGRHSA
jgi:hypothetical protein